MALKGKQKNIDMNKNNRIDAEDFALLKKKKEGKVMKAKRGMSTDEFVKRRKKLITLKKDPTKPISSVKPSAGGMGSGTTNLGNPRKKGDPFLERRFKLAGAKSLIGKAGRLGAVGTAVVAGAVGAKKLIDKIKEKKNKKMGGGLAAATERLRAKGLNKGGGADTGTAGEIRSKQGVISNKINRAMANVKRRTTDDLERFVNRLKANRRDSAKTKMMGGGMMMKAPGYKKGKSVMAKGCKLGRKKPTKMYT